MTDDVLSVILAGPHDLRVERIPRPSAGPGALTVRMRACGICGSDLRYLNGENPWALHTLGEDLVSPPNMVLGHEVAGLAELDGREERVAILAYRACGRCPACRSGRENICANVQHIGHATGWGTMSHYPGGMAEEFEVWPGFAYPLPESVSFDEATFLDGLAVAIHACDRARVGSGSRVAIVGLGPIGMLAAQVARSRGAERVAVCDTTPLPLELATGLGFDETHQASAERFLASDEEYDAIIDTIGVPGALRQAVSNLAPGGTLALLSVHATSFPLASVSLSAERSITTAANNRYDDFPRAIELLASGEVSVAGLVTHHFPLARAKEAFEVMANKDRERAYKIVLHP